MKENRIRRVVGEGRVAIGLLISEFGTRGIAKILEYTDIDFVTIDMEHSCFGMERVADLIAMFKATDIAPVVRVPEGFHHFIGGALDAGALAVQVAGVDNAEQARKIVAAAKYPSMGERGLGMNGAHTDFKGVVPSEYIPKANKNTMVIVGIESEQGLANVDAIAAVDGIDVLAIGHNDLSHALGVVGQLDHPRFNDAIQKVVDAARKHGKIAKIHPHSDAQTKKFVDMGYRMLMAHTDVTIFRHAAKAAVDNLRTHSKV